jgi:hypothetical protein
MTKEPKLAGLDFTRFSGTESYYRHALNRNVVYTDGAAFAADQCGAYWLLDSIALAQLSEKRVAAEPFQVWKLAVRPDRTAALTCEDGNYNVVYTQELEFTDFPEPGITLWLSNGVIYLPSEH